MIDTLKIYGRVIIQEMDGDKLISECAGDNLVLNAGLLNVERLLGGHANGKKISSIGVGTNGTAADPADTTLTGAVLKILDSVDYLPGNIVSFTATLVAGDPAMNIQEVGLFNDANVLCHRKVFDPPKVKVAGLSYRIIYQIKVR